MRRYNLSDDARLPSILLVLLDDDQRLREAEKEQQGRTARGKTHFIML